MNLKDINDQLNELAAAGKILEGLEGTTFVAKRSVRQLRRHHCLEMVEIG